MLIACTQLLQLSREIISLFLSVYLFTYSFFNNAILHNIERLNYWKTKKLNGYGGK